MKTTTTNYYGEEFEIELYFSHQIAGYGHWHILCEVTYEGEEKTFKHLTTDSEFIDKVRNAETWNEVQKVYYDKAFDDLEEMIREWCEQVSEELEENE